MPGTVMIDNDPDNHGTIDNFQMTVSQSTGDEAVIYQLHRVKQWRTLACTLLQKEVWNCNSAPQEAG